MKTYTLYWSPARETANESALETLEHAIKHVERETNADNGNDQFDAAHILIEAHQAIGPCGRVPSWESSQEKLFQ